MTNNICVVCDDFPSENRPVYVFVEQLVKELVKQGQAINVIAPQSLTRHFLRGVPLLPTKTRVEIGNDYYHVFRPYSISFGNHFRFLNFFVKIIRESVIENCIKKLDQKPDCIYGHFWHNAYAAKSYAYKYGIPLFVACGEGDNALEELNSHMTDKEKSRFTKAVKGVISVSSENKRKCVEFNLATEDNTIVLPNSVDTSLFVKDTNKNIRAEIGIDKDDFVIAFTGAFIKRKGSSRLSDAISLLNDSKIKSIFIGSPLDGDDCTPTCAGIAFMGRLGHNLVPQYLYAADCFCLPTLKEGCSNAIVEALAAGLPVISSNLPFNDDILDENNSIRINPLDINQIANAIQQLKDNKELREKLAQGALKKAEDLKIDVRASKIIQFINSRIEKNNDSK